MKFRIGSIPVLVQPGFFFASLVLGWHGDSAAVAIWVAVCFVSILVHEMGHALVIARFGGTPRILLYAGGGLTYGDKSETHGRRMLVSLAGSYIPFARTAEEDDAVEFDQITRHMLLGDDKGYAALSESAQRLAPSCLGCDIHDIVGLGRMEIVALDPHAIGRARVDRIGREPHRCRFSSCHFPLSIP